MRSLQVERGWSFCSPLLFLYLLLLFIVLPGPWKFIIITLPSAGWEGCPQIGVLAMDGRNGI